MMVKMNLEKKLALNKCSSFMLIQQRVDIILLKIV